MPTPESIRFTTLRLVPLLSTTASTAFAISEFWTLFPFLQPAVSSQSLSPWFNSWYKQALIGIVGWSGTSLITGYLGWRDSAGAARMMYRWGTLFAAGHFLFAPGVAKVIRDIVDKPAESKENVKLWLKIHALRTVTTDIPAMVCFLGAFLHIA